MHFRNQLIFKLCLSTFLMIWAHTVTGEMLRDGDSLNALYDNLLQREYIGPIAFPNHQVERKAQRSPSLRLRFGRRSDPDLLPQMPEKRWFGDVNQKPIRSPSLRLRFGRRSDPTMPLHSPLDMLMMNDQQQQTNDNNSDDYNDVYGNYFERIVRKPQRLRFGRSLPYQASSQQANENAMDGENIDDATVGNLNDAVLSNTEEDFYNTLMHSQKLRNLLMSLRQFSDASQDEVNDDAMSLENDMNEFKRDIRKPGPLRLRWGRSTGGRSTQALEGEEAKAKVEVEPKKNLSTISNNVVKTAAHQTKD